MPYCSNECADLDWSYHGVGEHSRWHSDDKTMILARPRSSIQGNLWVGGIEALGYLSQIGAVVTILQRGRVSEQAIADRVGSRPHLRFYMHDDDSEPIENVFDKSTKFIDRHIRAGRNVLVHCYAGVSRSVTLCICYMMRKRGFVTPREALRWIQSVRSFAGPNEGFMRALEQYG